MFGVQYTHSLSIGRQYALLFPLLVPIGNSFCLGNLYVYCYRSYMNTEHKNFACNTGETLQTLHES